MEYSQLARELIDALRQEHSYLELSNKMQFSYDKVGKWVRGTRDIDWDEFTLFCNILKSPLQQSLAKAIHFDRQNDSSHEIAKFILQNCKIKDAADRVDIHPSRLRRIMNGATITVTEVLHLIDEFYPTRLQVFIESITDDYFHRISSLEDHRSLAQHYLNLFRRDPRFAVLIKLAATDEYKELPMHINGFFAKKIGCSFTQEEQMLSELQQRGLLKTENNKFIPTDFQLGSLTKDEQNEMIKAFINMAMNGFLVKQEDEIFSAMDLLVSDECYAKIKNLFKDCFYQAKQIALEDQEKKNHWRLVTLQIFEPSAALGKLKN